MKDLDASWIDLAFIVEEARYPIHLGGIMAGGEEPGRFVDSPRGHESLVLLAVSESRYLGCNSFRGNLAEGTTPMRTSKPEVNRRCSLRRDDEVWYRTAAGGGGSDIRYPAN